MDSAIALARSSFEAGTVDDLQATLPVADQRRLEIDATVPGTIWEILPGAGAPRHPVCGRYMSVMKGVAALRGAGFRFSAHPVVPAQHLGSSYDSRTVLPWTFRSALGVEIGLILVARVKGAKRP